MSVVDSRASCKPTRTNSGGIEDAIGMIHQRLEGMLDSVRSAATSAASFDSVERSLRSQVLQLGKQLADLFVQMQGDGDMGEQVTYSAGKGKAIGLRPVSARMSLPPRQWSYLLQEYSQMLAVDSAYELAMENLGKILDADFSVDTAEVINAQMGQAAGDFLSDLPKPQPGSEGKLLVASADCKDVPLVKNDAPKVAAFETAKKNPSNRRMAMLKLRAAFQSDHWDSFLKRRIKDEVRETHPNRDLLANYQPFTLAC